MRNIKYVRHQIKVLDTSSQFQQKSKANFTALLVIVMCLLAFYPFNLLAQDIIFKNDKTEIKTKVIEITNDVVKYREWDNQSGPIYNIQKSQVFMITYQNGKREYMTSGVAAPSINKVPNANSSSSITSKDPRFVFTPRDKGQPKSKTNYADRFGNIGVTVNTIGKTTIPTISVIDDFIFMPNIAFTFGVNGSYHSEEIMGYSTSITSFGLLAGGTYYLNELLKLDKSKSSAYGGLALMYTNASTSSDIPAANISSGGFGVFLRAGGRYHLSKRIGVFGEIQLGEGDPSFFAGLSILTFK